MSGNHYRLKSIVPHYMVDVPYDGSLHVMIYDNLYADYYIRSKWKQRGEMKVMILPWDDYPIAKLTFEDGIIEHIDYLYRPDNDEIRHIFPLTIKGWTEKRFMYWLRQDERMFSLSITIDEEDAVRYKDVVEIEEIAE